MFKKYFYVFILKKEKMEYIHLVIILKEVELHQVCVLKQ